MDQIQLAITVACKTTGATRAGMMSHTKGRTECEARQIAVLILKSVGYSVDVAALALGRSKVAVYKMINKSMTDLRLSRSFRAKFNEAMKDYERIESLRIAAAR